ncbi:hypothetical protein IE53DRAFT_359705 [Violaceomyces palustris]|uniref:Uncharacterized protein n=1 Tax=Violaceomyces palustris TaxID=1673888 RepID=A0ACD0P739_9BASI|nr:hypothetical protein IE53DRAFT_359705 [Violaceomyces palustris]
MSRRREAEELRRAIYLSKQTNISPTTSSDAEDSCSPPQRLLRSSSGGKGTFDPMKAPPCKVSEDVMSRAQGKITRNAIPYRNQCKEIKRLQHRQKRSYLFEQGDGGLGTPVDYGEREISCVLRCESKSCNSQSNTKKGSSAPQVEWSPSNEWQRVPKVNSSMEDGTFFNRTARLASDYMKKGIEGSRDSCEHSPSWSKGGSDLEQTDNPAKSIFREKQVLSRGVGQFHLERPPSNDRLSQANIWLCSQTRSYEEGSRPSFAQSSRSATSTSAASAEEKMLSMDKGKSLFVSDP